MDLGLETPNGSQITIAGDWHYQIEVGFDSETLPAEPFRTDDWPLTTGDQIYHPGGNFLKAWQSEVSQRTTPGNPPDRIQISQPYLLRLKILSFRRRLTGGVSFCLQSVSGTSIVHAAGSRKVLAATKVMHRRKPLLTCKIYVINITGCPQSVCIRAGSRFS